MFRIFFIAVLYSLASIVQCCAQAKLFYFITKEDRVGVKDGSGKIIIPADYTALSESDGDTINGQIIFLIDPKKRGDALVLITPYSAFNRKGEFLFTPFFFDNGPDYISEGLFRIVKNNKIGFADREGNVVIPPNFGFATPFQHGLSFYCVECSFYRDSIDADVEHNLRLNPDKWGILGKDGTILNNYVQARREKTDDCLPTDFIPPGFMDDVPEITDSLLAKLPPQFVYSLEEKKLLKKFTSAAYHRAMVLAKVLTDSGTKVSYEIVERPKSTFPFYWIKGFRLIGGVYTDAEENFLISSNGIDIYKYEPVLNGRQLLLPRKARLRRK